LREQGKLEAEGQPGVVLGDGAVSPRAVHQVGVWGHNKLPQWGPGKAHDNLQTAAVHVMSDFDKYARTANNAVGTQKHCSHKRRRMQIMYKLSVKVCSDTCVHGTTRSQ